MEHYNKMLYVNSIKWNSMTDSSFADQGQHYHIQ